jgi:hypothetical protein
VLQRGNQTSSHRSFRPAAFIRPRETQRRMGLQDTGRNRSKRDGRELATSRCEGSDRHRVRRVRSVQTPPGFEPKAERVISATRACRKRQRARLLP